MAVPSALLRPLCSNFNLAVVARADLGGPGFVGAFVDGRGSSSPHALVGPTGI